MGRRRGEQSMPCGISGLFGLFFAYQAYWAYRLYNFYNSKTKINVRILPNIQCRGCIIILKLSVFNRS